MSPASSACPPASCAASSPPPRTIDPALMFKALRMQPEQLGFQADATIAALTDLVSYVAGLRQA